MSAKDSRQKEVCIKISCTVEKGLTMKRHINTLYVTSQGTYLSKEGEAIVASIRREQKVKMPVRNIESIVCFGNVTCSPFLLGYCSENNVSVSFLNIHGRFLGRVSGPISGNVLLRREQFRWADDEVKSLRAAKYFLIGKLINSKRTLKRFLRDNKGHQDGDTINDAIQVLDSNLGLFDHINNLESLRGVEGIAANAYFSVFDSLILQNKDDFSFHSRNRRPPLDKTNAMLSFCYVLVMHDIRSGLETVGLDPAVGFLHADRPGRYSLALDLMEEFRSFFADRLILSLINRKQITGKHFRITDSSAVLLNDEGRKLLIEAYQRKKDEEILHPFLEEKCTYGRLFQLQALLLARWIRGDINGYPTFIWK